MKLTIGVMGASGGDLVEAVRQRAYRLGEVIAERDAILITGGCPGLPYEAVRGARAKGGLVVGISPALSIEEHRGKYRSPADCFDVLIYTGSGLMGREITNIRSCDILVIVGGRTGTLGEFAIAYNEWRHGAGMDGGPRPGAVGLRDINANGPGSSGGSGPILQWVIAPPLVVWFVTRQLAGTRQEEITKAETYGLPKD